MRRALITLITLYTLMVACIAVVVMLGGRPSPLMVPLCSVIGFSFAFLHAVKRLNWKRATTMLSVVFVVSLAFESIGVQTGWIYGPYHYTNKLGPLFLGLVPYLIPIVWFMMMYPSYVIADRIVPAMGHYKRIFVVAAIGGLIMTSWDIVMDPVMVRAGCWIWEVNGAYFGIPLQNFWGWWLTTFVSFTIFLLVSRSRHSEDTDIRLDHLALILYTVTALGEVLAALLIGLGGPAIAGLFAMLPWILIYILRFNQPNGST